MSFGQSTGPAAGHAQLKDLQVLLARAGYDDFRAARGPYQLTQRQGGGKFTREEADTLLERLREELGEEPADDVPALPARDAAPVAVPEPTAATPAAKVPPEVRAADDQVLVAELRRRGYRVFPPTGGNR